MASRIRSSGGCWCGALRCLVFIWAWVCNQPPKENENAKEIGKEGDPSSSKESQLKELGMRITI